MFPMLAGYTHMLGYTGELAPMALVGIGYGNDNWGTGNFRGTDYTAPAQGHPENGGAERFNEVLRDEIIPFIESQYPVDPSKRVLFGHSLGGQFVLFSALTDADRFWARIAVNPALHRNLTYFLDQSATPTASPSYLYVASGSEDAPVFRKPALEWMEYWSQQTSVPWVLKTDTLEGETHMSASPVAFRRGLKWLLEKTD